MKIQNMPFPLLRSIPLRPEGIPLGKESFGQGIPLGRIGMGREE